MTPVLPVPAPASTRTSGADGLDRRSLLLGRFSASALAARSRSPSATAARSALLVPRPRFPRRSPRPAPGRGGRSARSRRKTGRPRGCAGPRRGPGSRSDLARCASGRRSRPRASAGVGEQLLEPLGVDLVGPGEAVGGEIGGGLIQHDPARAPLRGAAQRVVEAADRLRSPELGDRDQVELQLQLRLLLELLPRGDPARELVVEDEGAPVGRPVDAVDRSVQAPAVDLEGGLLDLLVLARSPPPGARARSRRCLGAPPRRGSAPAGPLDAARSMALSAGCSPRPRSAAISSTSSWLRAIQAASEPGLGRGSPRAAPCRESREPRA